MTSLLLGFFELEGMFPPWQDRVVYKKLVPRFVELPRNIKTSSGATFELRLGSYLKGQLTL